MVKRVSVSTSSSLYGSYILVNLHCKHVHQCLHSVWIFLLLLVSGGEVFLWCTAQGKLLAPKPVTSKIEQHGHSTNGQGVLNQNNMAPN